MKQVVEYHYELYPNELIGKNGHYFFTYFNNKYLFMSCNRDKSDMQMLYEINQYTANNNLDFHSIVINKFNNILTEIYQQYFILLKIKVNFNDEYNLEDIKYIAQKSAHINEQLKIKKLNLIELWSQKIDYFEHHLLNNNQHQSVLETFPYYMGLAETALSYLNNNQAYQTNDDKHVISHRRLFVNGTLYDLYNPLEIIVDHYTRDIAEYIKIKFFYDNNPYQEVIAFLNNNNLTYYGYISLIARLLYPSYYFDLLEQIIQNLVYDKDVNQIIEKSKSYEYFLVSIIKYLNTKANLPKIEWLDKLIVY